MKTKQNVKLLHALQHGAYLTSMEALQAYGIARLASRINELKNLGYNIKKKMIEVECRDGSTVHVAQYYLEV